MVTGMGREEETGEITDGKGMMIGQEGMTRGAIEIDVREAGAGAPEGEKTIDMIATIGIDGGTKLEIESEIGGDMTDEARRLGLPIAGHDMCTKSLVVCYQVLYALVRVVCH